MPHTFTILLIIMASGILGGTANFLLAYKVEYTRKECWVNFFRSITLGLCASFVVPLLLHILTNNLLDYQSNIPYPSKNYFILIAFCVLAGFYSKRFLEDVYSKLNKLEKNIEEAKKDNKVTLDSVSETTSEISKKVDVLTELTEEAETDETENSWSEIANKAKESISKYIPNALNDTELASFIKAIFFSKFKGRTLKGLIKETGAEREVIVKALEHLKDHGFITKWVETNGNDYWRKLKFPYRIYSGTYKWPTGHVDVTDAVRKMVARGELTAVVDPITFGISDPKPGTPKTLHLHWRSKGDEKADVFNDGQTFIIS